MNAQHTAQRHSEEAPIIPGRREGVTVLRIHAFLAVMTGLALRLLFVFGFPCSSDDGELYLQLARNWVDHHVYGMWLYGRLVPTDLRMPGYPAFLAGLAILLGRSTRAIMLSQAAIDLCTCFLTAVLAASLAPAKARRTVWIAAVWLAATCPFVANYTAILLTEALVSFLTIAALVCFVLGLKQLPPAPSFSGHDPQKRALALAALGAFLTGIATLVRPEMTLLLVAAALVYVFRWWRPLDFRKMALLCVAMAGAFLLPVAPWAVRNFVTLHEVQMVAPRYTTLPSEYAPVGYYAWTGTWLERYRDVYVTIWKIGEEPQEIDDIPSTAFDSPQERARVAALFDQYDASPNLDVSPELDQQFAEIARERTKRHPLRTYIQVPFKRALTIWFTPRTELLPIDGKLWPLREQWEDSRANVLTTAGLAALGYLYIALAAGGIWVAWRAGRETSGVAVPEEGPNLWGIALLLAYLLIRTTFLTTVEGPEPRYVVSCYPAVLAMAALLFGRIRSQAEK